MGDAEKIYTERVFEPAQQGGLRQFASRPNHPSRGPRQFKIEVVYMALTMPPPYY